jgi:type II secretory pathway pseudopilin PulG
VIEVLVILAVVAVLVGGVGTGIQKVRVAARRAEGLNDVRQLVGAIHQYASTAKGGRLPGWCGVHGPKSNCTEQSPIGEAQELLNPPKLSSVDIGRGNGGAVFAIVSSRADPSLSFHPTAEDSAGNASYAANYRAFVDDARKLPDGQPDGTSATLAVVEHYARCGRLPDGLPAGNFFGRTVRSSKPLNESGAMTGNMQFRPASFADSFYGDVYPTRAIGTNGPQWSWPSRAGATFQVRPAVPDCDPTVPQTPHPGGMVAGLMDGSVRVLRGGMAPHLFWSAVTPAGGETAALD